MKSEKACRTCRKIIEDAKVCPNCQGSLLTTFWRGYVMVLDPEKSEISKKMGITTKGKHALRVSQ